MIECSLNSESTPLPPWLMLQLCELKLVWLCLELAATAHCRAFVRKIVRRCFFTSNELLGKDFTKGIKIAPFL